MGSADVVRTSAEATDLTALRDAYRKMQALSSTDNRGWLYWADLHGFPSFDCWHHFREGPGNTTFTYNLFLPWHRAYLLSWEHVVRDQNDAAIPPFWDWTSAASHEVGVPEAFTLEQVNGEPNPLANGPTPEMPGLPAHRTRRFPGDPAELPTTDDLTNLIKNTSTFEDFTNQIEDIHDAIHGWVGGIDPTDPSRGGDMGVVATSAFDPLFWAHHCMIDRVWYLWQLEHGVNNIPPSYRHRPLAPFSLTSTTSWTFTTSDTTTPSPPPAPRARPRRTEQPRDSLRRHHHSSGHIGPRRRLPAS